MLLQIEQLYITHMAHKNNPVLWDIKNLSRKETKLNFRLYVTHLSHLLNYTVAENERGAEERTRKKDGGTS